MVQGHCLKRQLMVLYLRTWPIFRDAEDLGTGRCGVRAPELDKGDLAETTRKVDRWVLRACVRHSSGTSLKPIQRSFLRSLKEPQRELSQETRRIFDESTIPLRETKYRFSKKAAARWLRDDYYRVAFCFCRAAR